MNRCIEAMEIAYKDYASSGTVNIPRIRYRSDTSEPDTVYASNIHIGTTPSLDAAAIRLGGSPRSRFPGAQGEQVSQFQNRNWGFICLVDMRTGQLLAIVQEFFLSGIRVGATSGLAVKHLASPEATRVGMYGSGKLARTDLEAFALVRNLQHVKIYSPNPQHRLDFAAEMSEKLGIEIEPVSDPKEAARDVDIVCCATNAGYVSGQPALHGEWLEPGQLLVTLQNSDANFYKTEVDEVALTRSKSIIINDRESVYSNNQMELLDPIERGVISWDRITTLAEVVSSDSPFRSEPDDIVYYKNSTGMGIQMSAACALIYRDAISQGIGHEIPTEWFGSDLTEWNERGFFPSS